MKFLPLSIPVIKGNEWKYVKECLDTGWVSTAGKFVDCFEKKIAGYTKSPYAIGCINGTAALHTALLSLKIEPNDEVIVPTVSFIAPINAVKYVGAFPVFMDCDEYLNIDPEKVKMFVDRECQYKNGKLINKASRRQVKAIIPVHIFGHLVNIEPIMELAAKYNLKIIEDATESLGSYYLRGKFQGKHAGTIGDIGCLSFNGNKIITTGGGGMIITGGKKLADKTRYLSIQAKDDELMYVHSEIGYNYRLTNVAAAIGLAQLEELDNYIEIKRRNFFKYRQYLNKIPGISLIEEPPYAFSNYWLYSLVIDENIYGRSNMTLMNIFAKEKIQARPLWMLNHKQKPYRNCQSYKITRAPQYYSGILNIPSSVNLVADDIKRITTTIEKKQTFLKLT